MSVWKPVAGYDGAYEVAATGEVRSVSRPVHNGRGATRMAPARTLIWYWVSYAYGWCVHLRRDNKTLRVPVRDIVIETWREAA